MKEAVLQDKRGEHASFCRYGAALVERVSGKPLPSGSDVSLAHLQRANVVARTCITFPEEELLLLIRSHLLAKGLHASARTLAAEASLGASPLRPSPRTPRLAAGVRPHGAGAPPLSAGSSSPPSRCLISPPPAAPPTPRRQGPHVQPSRALGRVLFARERPVVHGNAGRKLCVLKQKSERGAFVQVSHT